MYKIVRTDYGLHITMSGQYAKEEIQRYVAEKEAILNTFTEPYSLLVDLRSAIPPEDADEGLLAQSQRRMKGGHLLRMAIIVMSPVLEAQAKQIVFTSGLEDRTRVINANRVRTWDTAALDWIIKGVEPINERSTNDSSPNPIQLLGTFSRKL